MSAVAAGTADRAGRRARVVRMPRAETLRLLLFFAAVAAAYAWILQTSIPGFRFDQVHSGPYGWLGDALVHGQLNLRYPVVPDQLRVLPNPYDPGATESFRWTLHLHDLSYYHEKLYLYWGVVPALLLFAPLRLAGIWMYQGLAVAMLCFAGLVFSVLTLRFLVRRFLPRTPSWALWAGMVTLACGNAVPFMLRRAEHSEVAIGGGLCFGFLAIWLFLTGWYGERGRSLPRIAGASLALGLAVGSRPTWVVATLVPLVLAVVVWRAGRTPDRTRLLAALLVPLAICGALVCAYNFARFGAPAEFGSKYQLAAYPQSQYGAYTPAFLLPGLFFYVFEPPHLTPLFPFFQLGPPPDYPWTLPAGYIPLGEPTGGILPVAPIVLLLAALPLAWRRWGPELRRIVPVLAALGIGIVLFIAGALWSTTERYAVDYTALLLIAALLVWFTALTTLDGARRRVVAIAGGALLAYGAIIGIAVSFTGYGMPLANKDTGMLSRFESTFSPVSRLLSGVAGRPVVGRISPVPSGLPNTRWSSLGRDPVGFLQGVKPTTVRVASAHGGVHRLRVVLQPGGDLAAPGNADLRIATRHGAVGVSMQGGQPAQAVLPVRLDAGVTSLTFMAGAGGSTGPSFLIVAIQGIDD